MDNKEYKKTSKETAQKLGQKWYFTNTPCKNNHIDRRYVNTGICYACKENRIEVRLFKPTIKN